MSTGANILPTIVDESKESDPEKAMSTSSDGEAKPNLMDPASYPDGGLKAWLACFGGFCCLFVSFGWINAIGIFQEYYQTNTLASYSPSTVSWIVSLEVFFMFIGGPFVGKLFDNYGPRYLLLGGSFLHVFGLMMTSLSTEYYQFILAQGICSPIGSSAVFYAAMSSVVTWFFERRAFALGMMASGSSLGGVIFPIMVQRLIPMVGFAWTMRIVAFLILGLLIIANLTVRSRLPPAPRPFSIREFITPLGQLSFALLTGASFLIFLGLFIPFNYITVIAPQTVGMSPDLAQYLLSILNAASIFGRILPGWLGDRFGRFNVTVLMCYMCGILCLALWLPAAANTPVILFSAFYGFGSGAFVSMMPALVAKITDIRQIGVRSGTLFALISIAGLIGNPIGEFCLSTLILLP